MEERRMRCIFVDEWICQIEVDEIPLEVCRLCVDARVGQANKAIKTIKRTRIIPPKLESKIDEAGESLLSLDRLFMDGKINLENYLKKRREAVERREFTQPSI
jgi:hypothetical protein